MMKNSPQVDNPDTKKHQASDQEAAIIREMIRHEDNVINHRITWLSQLQGFLFAALSFAWDKKGTEILIYGVCAFGALVAISSVISLTSANGATDELRRWWRQNRVLNYSGPPTIGLPRHKNEILKHMYHLFYPWYFLPRLFIFAWILIAIAYFRTH